jgi:hypothetical protein
MNKVISAIVFLAAMMAWTPTYADVCPGTRIVASEDGSWVVSIDVQRGKFYEIVAGHPDRVRTGDVIVDCVPGSNILTMQQQNMLYQGKPDANWCTYRLLMRGSFPSSGLIVEGTYKCTTIGGVHALGGILVQ